MDATVAVVLFLAWSLFCAFWGALIAAWVRPASIQNHVHVWQEPVPQDDEDDPADAWKRGRDEAE